MGAAAPTAPTANTPMVNSLCTSYIFLFQFLIFSKSVFSQFCISICIFLFQHEWFKSDFQFIICQSLVMFSNIWWLTKMQHVYVGRNERQAMILSLQIR